MVDSNMLFYSSLIAAVLFFVLFLRERQRRKLEHQFNSTEKNTLLSTLETSNRDKNTFLEEKQQLKEQLIQQQSIHKNLQEKIDRQLVEQQRLLEENRLRFENISNKILEEKTAKFTKQNAEHLQQLLRPFQERIRVFEKKVEETYHKGSQERLSLKEEFKRTLELNQVLSEQAENLTRALKSDGKSQGDWGEYLLSSVLEAAGLQEGIHYKNQFSISTASGRRLRPDVVLFLPEGKHIVIDSKVSLTAYERYTSAVDENERNQALKAHLLSIKKHINELSDKKYERFLAHSPDFVLMFVPVEPAYNLALMQHPGLYEDAFKKKVILVSVSSLMATLRIIESIWRLEKQNKNAGEIIEEGNKLYDKFVGFVDDMLLLEKRLDGAKDAFDAAMNKLESGRGNLIGRAEKMKNLGLNPSKQLPER